MYYIINTQVNINYNLSYFPQYNNNHRSSARPSAENNNVDIVMLTGCNLGCNLEVVDIFFYLGDLLDAGGCAESTIITRVRSGRGKSSDSFYY